jgi:ornithine carbamoyltransferase
MKHFIDINNFKKTEIDEIIALAKKIKKNPKKYSSSCKNKTLGLIFEKQSLRTRLSFNVGMQKLGGSVLELQGKDIGFDNKREKAEDVLNVLSQYIDFLMIRNDNHKQIVNLSKENILPIINGLTEYSHPCQILGDFLTLQENFKNYKNLIIVWIGDYNNVLRSLIHLQNIYKFKLNIVVPHQIFKHHKSEFLKFKNKNLKHLVDPIEGAKKSNCIMTDVWVSMGEKNNKIKYFKNFTVNKKIMSIASNNAIFMHCLPAKRGKEVTSDVLDGKNSVVLQQAKNRMYIQQAILIYVLKK